MQVKNISGKTLYIGLPAPYKGKELANNATTTFEDVPEIENAVRTYITAGTLQLISGPAEGVTSRAITRPAWGVVKFAHSGGTSVADHDSVTISGKVNGVVVTKILRWDDTAGNNETAVAGSIYVGAGGGTDAEEAADFIVAVNSVTALTGIRAEPLIAVGADTHVVLCAVAGDAVQTGANYTLAKSGVDLAVSGAAFFNGAIGKDADTAYVSYTVTAANVTDTIWAIPTGLTRDITWWSVQIFTPAGGLVLATATAPTALFTLKDDANGIANMVLVTDAAGGTSLTEGSVINIVARC